MAADPLADTDHGLPCICHHHCSLAGNLHHTKPRYGKALFH